MPLTAPALMTAQQRRCLFALLKARGLDSRDDRLAVAGVASFRDLTADAAARLIERLQSDRPQRRQRPDRPALRTPRITTEMSAPQYHAILDLLAGLGWSDALVRGWLLKRHRVRDLARDHVARADASAIITELSRAYRKSHQESAS